METCADDVAALIAQVANRDQQAFARLQRLTGGKLFIVAFRILQDRSDTEEVVQDAYFNVWRYAATYRRSDKSPISWLAKIARNSALDKLRSRDPFDRETGIQIESRDECQSAEQVIILAQTARHAKACLAQIDPFHASLISRAYLLDESYKSLSIQTGVPINTVRTWLRRGLKRTNALMAAQAGAT